VYKLVNDLWQICGFLQVLWIELDVIKFVSDLWQICGFLHALWLQLDVINKCLITQKGQSKIYGTQDEEKQSKNTTQYVSDTTIRKQTQIT